MLRRIILFGFGALISIFFLSLGPENRLKKTFYAYVDYFNVDKRVIYHLNSDETFFSTKSECQLVYYNLDKNELLSVLDGGKINFSKSDKDRKPCQLYFVENMINSHNTSKTIFYNSAEVLFEYCSVDNKVTVKSFIINQEEGVCEN